MSDATEEEKPANKVEEVIADARKYLELCKSGNAQNVQNGLDDLRFLQGGANQWDEIDAAARTLDRRPMVTVNPLPTYLHQITNGLRQNRSSIKVHPASSGANVEKARVRQGIIRHIEYNSNADVAYSTAACSAAAIGFGYFRIVTDYTSKQSFEQELRFKRIRNPFTVHFDPTSEEPDGSDQKRCLIESRMSRKDFKRTWPDSEANNTSLAIGSGDISMNWLFADEVVIGEFYRIEEEEKELCLLMDGSTAWLDELDETQKLAIVGKRKSSKRKVMLYKITGCDILEEAEIMSYWIPVFPVYGDELDINGEVIRSGLIRHAKSPMQQYNYFMTAATEEVSMRVKAPFIGAAGQFDGYETDWKQANKRAFPYLQYNPVTIDGNLAPAPQRQAMADIPSGMLQMAMHAKDNIKATTGIFDSSLGARGNATSGKQERAQQEQSERANFHYLDGLQLVIRHAGRVLNYAIPYYMDTMRAVKIMGEDDKISSVVINQPNPEISAIESVLNDMTGGEYTVTVESGPPYQTLRQEAAELFSNLAHNNQGLMEIAGDLIIGEMDIPGANKIATRIKKSIDPKLTEGENDEDRDGVDAKLQQIGQMKQQLDQQQQAMEEQGQMLQEAETKAREDMMKAREAQNQVDVDKISVDAERAVMKAEFQRMQAEMRLSEAQSQTTDPAIAESMKIEFERWKAELQQETDMWKANLQEDTKLAIAQINQETTITTAALKPQKENDYGN